MPVIGALLTFAPNREDVALGTLTNHPNVTLGEAVGDRHPIVVDTPDRATDRAFWKALEADASILHLEIAFADFSDLTPPAQGGES